MISVCIINSDEYLYLLFISPIFKKHFLSSHLQIAKSTNRQIDKLANHQIDKSPNWQIDLLLPENADTLIGVSFQPKYQQYRWGVPPFSLER